MAILMSVNEEYRDKHNKALAEFGEKLRKECAGLGFGCTIEWDRKKPYNNGVYEFYFELNRYEGVPLTDADNPAPQAPNKLRTIKGFYGISGLIMRDDVYLRLARELLHFLDKERREEFVMGQYEKLSDNAQKLFHHACNENIATMQYQSELPYFNELIATTLVHHNPNPIDIAIFPTGDGRLVNVLVKEGKAKKDDIDALSS